MKDPPFRQTKQSLAVWGFETGLRQFLSDACDFYLLEFWGIKSWWHNFQENFAWCPGELSMQALDVLDPSGWIYLGFGLGAKTRRSTPWKLGSLNLSLRTDSFPICSDSRIPLKWDRSKFSGSVQYEIVLLLNAIKVKRWGGKNISVYFKKPSGP